MNKQRKPSFPYVRNAVELQARGGKLRVYLIAMKEKFTFGRICGAVDMAEKLTTANGIHVHATATSGDSRKRWFTMKEGS